MVFVDFGKKNKRYWWVIRQIILLEIEHLVVWKQEIELRFLSFAISA